LSTIAALVGIAALTQGPANADVKAQGLSKARQGATAEAPATQLVSFCNSTPITITDNTGSATPHPSSIAVSGLTGVVSSVRVTLNGFSHTYPADVSALVVGPTGKSLMLWSQAGGDNTTPAVNANVTLDDAATQYIPDIAAITTGTYRPANYTGADGAYNPFLTPAPQATTTAPFADRLATFRGTNPNGTWNLFMSDSFSGDTGNVAAGWCVDITTAGGAVTEVAQNFQGSLAAGDLVQSGRLVRDGFVVQATDTKICPGPNAPSAGSSLFYDTYTFTNNNTVAVPVAVTTTSACGGNIFTSAYTAAYNPADFCANYLADAGFSPSTSGQGPAFSMNVNSGQTITLVVNQTTAGTPCSAYSVLVEGDIRAPLAAGVSVTGHVFGIDNVPLNKATVTLTNQFGQTRRALTNASGAYVFDDVEAGQTYTLTATYRRFPFGTKILQISDSIADADFNVQE